MTRDDVEALLRMGMAIANRYSVAYRAHSYSTQMIGHDDYLGVLGAVGEKINRHVRELNEEMQRAGIQAYES